MFQSVQIIYKNFEVELRRSENNFPQCSILRNHPIQTFSRMQLLKAAAEGDIVKVESLLKKKTNVDAKKNPALHVAETPGNLHDYTLENHEPNYNATPLHFACLNGHLDVTQLLVTNGADIEAGDDYGITALHLASGNGHKNIVEFLIKSGANCNVRNRRCATPLHFAAEEGRLNVLQCLILNGAYFNARTDATSIRFENWTPLMFSINNYHIDVMKILLQIAVSVESDYIDSMRIAKAETFCIAFEFLISINKHVKQVGLHNFQQLLKVLINKSCELGHRRMAILKMLIEMGVNINFKYEDGMTALHYAVKNEHLDMIMLLLKNYPEVNALRYSLRINSAQSNSYTNILLEYGCSRTTTLNCINTLPQCSSSVKHVILYHLLYYPEERMPSCLSGKFRRNEEFNGSICLSKYWGRCLFEIQEMKKKFIDKYSIYTICVERNLNRLASYTKSESLRSYCNSGACKTDYPNYGRIIMMRFKRGTYREELIRKLDKLQIYSKTQNETEKVIPMNRECWLKVAEYLSSPDLLSLLKSSICELCSPSITSTFFGNSLNILALN